MINQVLEEKLLIIDKSKWKLTKLGTLAEDISIRVDKPGESVYDRFVGLDNFVSGDIKIKSWASTKNLTSSAKAFKAGDILFARRNAYLRRASLVDFDGCCSGDAFVIRENLDKVVPGFLSFLMNTNSLWDYANSNAAGTMSKRVKWRDLAEYEFLLPPKSEQASLAELLWAMDDVIQKEKGILLAIELVRDVCREKLFTYGIKSIENEKIVKTKNGRVGRIPDNWEEERFDDVIKITNGQVDPKKDEYKKLVQIGAERIEPNTGKILEYQTAEELDIISGNYLFTDEHLIFSKIRPYLKKVANPNMIGLCSADIYPLLPNTNVLTKDFLFYYLLTEKFTRRLLKFQNRTGMPKVNREEIGAMYVPIPTKDEQSKIVHVLRDIDMNRDLILDTIKNSKSLQKRLLNQIF